jgi:hypothetical protein
MANHRKVTVEVIDHPLSVLECQFRGDRRARSRKNGKLGLGHLSSLRSLPKKCNPGSFKFLIRLLLAGEVRMSEISFKLLLKFQND